MCVRRTRRVRPRPDGLMAFLVIGRVPTPFRNRLTVSDNPNGRSGFSRRARPIGIPLVMTSRDLSSRDNITLLTLDILHLYLRKREQKRSLYIPIPLAAFFSTIYHNILKNRIEYFKE